MATAKTSARVRLTGAEWRDRAEQLAYEKHLVNAANYVGVNELGAHVWRLPSRSESGTYYLVTVWPEIQQVVCSCTAGSYLRPCGHAGAALHADRQRERAMRQPADPMAAWRMGLEEW